MTLLYFLLSLAGAMALAAAFVLGVLWALMWIFLRFFRMLDSSPNDGD